MRTEGISRFDLEHAEALVCTGPTSENTRGSTGAATWLERKQVSGTGTAVSLIRQFRAIGPDLDGIHHGNKVPTSTLRDLRKS